MNRPKKNILECYNCGTKHEAGDVEGLACDQGHFLCNRGVQDSCLRSLFSNALKEENWLSSVPIKCAICKTNYHPPKLEAFFTPQEHKKYLSASICVTIAASPTEELVRCPFCPWAVVYAKRDKPLLFFCQNGACRRKSCGVCLLEFTDDTAEQHLLTCGEWGAFKREIELVVEEASQRQCPKCQCKGMKDDNCTHMTCMRCSAQWCYFCGLPSDQCSLAPNSAWPIGHQEDWATNKGRCPIYLQELHTQVHDCRDDPKQALEFFHRYRILRVLSRKMAQVGARRLEGLVQRYPAVLGGFTLADVRAFREHPFLRDRMQ